MMLTYAEVRRMFGGFYEERELSLQEAVALEKEFASPEGFREAYGDVWELARGKSLAIPTNGSLRKDGSAVMGRGVALQAAKLFPGLPRRLGVYLQKYGNRCFYLGKWGDYAIASFPTKHSWKEKADLELIKVSAVQLVKIADKFDLSEVYLPRPGCGEGGLAWEAVEPVLRTVLDGRFVICER
jgi:hypothetical protein